MSATIPESDSSTVGVSTADDKVDRLCGSAHSAMVRSEFAAAVSILEEIPENLRTDEVKKLYAEACRARHVQKQLESAKRQFNSRQYEFAVQSIAQIPEEDRNEECNQLEQAARVHMHLAPILDSARTKMDIRKYEEALGVLDEVPVEIRTREVLELLREAQGIVDELAGFWDRINAKSRQAENERSWERYAEILPLLDQIDLIRPRDARAADKRLEIAPLEERFRKRDLLMAAARRCFDNRDYETTVERLQRIPEDDRCGQYDDLSIQNEENRITVQEAYKEVAEAICAGEIEKQITLWKRLDDLQYYPVEQLIAGMTEDEFDKCLNDLVAGANDDRATVELLNLYIEPVSPEWVLNFLGRCDDGFIDNYPVQSRVLSEKLCVVLDQLAGDPKRLRNRFEQLQAAVGQLGDDAKRVADWDRFLKAADGFQELHGVEWTWQERLYEGSKSKELDAAAAELAEAGNLVVPAETNLREFVNAISSGNFNRDDNPFKRAYAKLREFSAKGEWPRSPLVPITPRRIAITAGCLAGLTVLGLAANLALALLFNVGGWLGFGMVFFLAGLWTSFCFAANKVL